VLSAARRPRLKQRFIDGVLYSLLAASATGLVYFFVVLAR
jgi:hypothetical protein